MKEKEAGLITVEVAIMLTMFIMFFVAILRIMDAVAVQARIQRAVSLAAKEISAYGYLENSVYDPVEFGMLDDLLFAEEVMNPVPNTTFSDHDSRVMSAAEDLSYYAGTLCRDILKKDPEVEDYLKKHGVKGGLSGISFTKSSLLSDNRVRITACYRIQYLSLPFLPNNLFSKTIVVNATTGLWED